MTLDSPLIALTEAEFTERFLPTTNAEDSDVWEHAETLTRPTTFVWSIIEVDGDQFALPGYHVVNVTGYMVTRNPWPHENVEVRL